MLEIPQWLYIGGDAEAQFLLEYLQHLDMIAIDTETTGLIKHKDEVVFWSISDGIDRWCLPRSLLPVFKPYLEDPSRTLIFHNANYDTWMLQNSGVDLFARCPRYHFRRHDTMTMHVLFEDDAPSRTLKFVGPDVICTYNNLPKFKMPGFKETFGKGAKINDTARVLLEAPIARVADYASLDAWVTYRVYVEIKKYLQQREVPKSFNVLMGLPTDRTYTLWDYYELIESPLHDVLYFMERKGMLIDPDFLRTLAEPMRKRMKQYERKVAKVAGRVVNLNSPYQMRWLFFSKDGPYNLEPISWTDGGMSGNRQPSTKADVLEELAITHEVADDTIKYRRLGKLINTYIDGNLPRLDEHNRLRCNINQHIVTTGRFSTDDPNLQNLPMRREEGRRIREGFIAPDGHLLMVCDEEQLEARITAGMCADPAMCKAIQGGMDYHSSTTALMFGVSYNDVIAAKKADKKTAAQKELKRQRDVAKTIGFALLYGAGVNKLAKQLKVTPDKAKTYFEKYHAAYPSVRTFFDDCIGFAEQNEYICTLLGRRRNLKGIRSPEWRAHADAERKAQNTPIQGTASEIMKLAMLRIYLDEDIWSSGARMTMQIHDEIIMECDEKLKQEPWFKDRIRHYMSHPFEAEPLPLPDGSFIALDAIPNFGKNWVTAK